VTAGQGDRMSWCKTRAGICSAVERSSCARASERERERESFVVACIAFIHMKMFVL
jgi:hypothetical protein